MKKFGLPVLALTILFSLISSCSDDNESNVQKPDPIVITLSSEIGVNGGVHLSGNFNSNDNEINQIGFEYSIDSLFNNRSIVVSDQNIDNQISYFIKNGIIKDSKYYYKAYAKSSGKTFYGDTKNFISDGSVIPEIKTISNEFGHIEDTLTISGKYFIDNNFQTQVYFSEIESELISINDSLIKCKIPTNIDKIINTVKVKIDNRVGSYESFTLYTPVINNVEPIKALIGDTLLVKGNHYDLVNNRNKVLFGNIEGTILESNRESLKVIVPESIETPSETLKIKAQLQEVSYSESFQLLAPQINSISPLSATFRDEITITGDNFDFEITRNKVYFGNTEATITYADKNTIKVIVPDNLESSSTAIKVIAQLQEVTFNENFKLIPPQINFIPENVKTKQEITIQGKFFHPVLTKNKVTIENIEVDLANGDTENLSTSIPLGPFPRRKAIVKIQLLDLIVEYETDLKILDNWIMISNELPFRYNRSMGNAAVIESSAFVICPSQEILDNAYYLWTYDTNNKTWSKKDLPFQIGVNESGGILESNGNNLYVYLPNDNNDFWEYNFKNDSWSKKSPFIGNRRDGSTHFSINNDIYIGLGKDFSEYIPISYKDLYKYSPSQDKWEQLSDVPFGPYEQNGRIETATFVINNTGYFAGGALTTGDNNCWAYNSTSNTWTRIADFETPRSYSTGFSLNGFGYVSGGSSVGGSNRKDCWRYNPNDNSWIQVEDVGHIERGGHFSFVINGRAYIGSGGIYSSGGTGGYDFYEFIP